MTADGAAADLEDGRALEAFDLELGLPVWRHRPATP